MLQPTPSSSFLSTSFDTKLNHSFTTVEFSGGGGVLFVCAGLVFKVRRLNVDMHVPCSGVLWKQH